MTGARPEEGSEQVSLDTKTRWSPCPLPLHRELAPKIEDWIAHGYPQGPPAEA